MLKYDVILKLAQLIDGWIFKFSFWESKSDFKYFEVGI